MKSLTITAVILILLSKMLFAQGDDRNFNQISQTYYLKKDTNIINKAIDFINKTPMGIDKLNPILTGFFGAAFLDNPKLKKDFLSNIDRVEKPEIKKLLVYLSTANVDSIYLQTKPSPSLNDMNWASFFATGKVKYLDNIIAQIPNIDNRVDVNVFLAGASAKWSLCGNSRKHEAVNKRLALLKDNNQAVKEILEKEPQYFNEVIIAIIKQQREKGLWN
ncbi:hypothetical protein [Pedobacter aquatilis]|uniref:hypothetical protein n=1 Tax=Pedobacter aquatilis TaxID=351343 RepID=UPI00292EF37F|nr:hypothetical protein [Pedobacter aquatilis]